MTSPEGLLFQTTYWPLRLFSRYMKNGRLLNLGFTPDSYEGPTYPEWIQHISKPAYVDCVAMIVEEQGSKHASIRLSVLNRHPTADWNGNITFEGFQIESVESYVLYHDHLLAKNTFENPNVVVPKVTKYSGKQWTDQGSQPIQKHSWSFFIFEGTVL